MSTRSMITPDTLIPLSVLGVVCGGIAWLGAMHMDLSHANSEIKTLSGELTGLMDNQRSIDRKLSKIEGQLEFIINHIQQKNMHLMLRGVTP